ncbi:RNA 2',3'-cyclic phosphodiesterase [Saliniradius amylolyticus]|uniref:RNA 2',3'-cyclic phosphodiesterase n=1 Tax=Saliniradius amylolyticus TaxID=2183582 RepID=A0A2S2E007_9ALTE|nr:RNA 2',3'-cyclic phosphodiesterase [Saliniradius amylolyticus]AWL10978.1 RNA 2',3'-cyclic phosphodiesterase [Saliniradius amylolyticus]
MRTFFALDLASEDKLALEKWRSKNFPFFHRPVPMANFHITLAFLGDTSADKMEKLLSGADAIEAAPVRFDANQMGYWQRPGIVFLGDKQPDDALYALAQKCQALGARLRLNKEDKRYHPHVTLFRKVEQAPPVALTEPDFSLRFDHFSLMQSIPARDGVQYRELERWPLRNTSESDMSIREQLARGLLR